MKIKFEVRLTASKALLAVLAAMVGLSVKAEDQERVFENLPKAPALEVPDSQKTEGAPAEDKPRATRTRTAAPKVNPIPEKIVPPPTLTAEEAIEQEERTQAPEPEAARDITIEDVRGFGGKLIQKDDVKYRPLVMATLQAHGAIKFSELDPSQYASTLEDLKLL